MSRILPAQLIAAIAVALALAGCEEAARTRVRVVHAATATIALDVWVDGQIAVTGLASGDATDWIDASPGSTVQVMLGGISASATIDEDGDHIASFSDGSSSLAIGRLPPPARRGFEILLLGEGSPTTITVPGRDGLRAQTRPGRTASLVLPPDVDRIHLEGPRWARDVLLDDALRARGRVILLPLGSEGALSTWISAPGLVVVDPDRHDAWILPPAPRVRGLVALSGGSAAMLVGDVEAPPSCPTGTSCVLAGIDTGTHATVSLVVPGSGAVIDTFELEDLRAGEEHIVLATGDASGPIRWIHVPFELSPLDPQRALQVVHAAPRLPPLEILQVGTGASLGTIGPGEHLEVPASMSVLLSTGSGELTAIPVSFGESPSIVIVTSDTARLEEAEVLLVLPSAGWIIQRVMGSGPR